nr:PH domain-containing protein [Psychrobacter sp. PraFG1]UNK05431.1 PH domain-containing protein [Psychrobacter sp. PraFG1]
MPEMVFYSKIDLWIHGVFIVTTLVVLALPYLYYKSRREVSFIQSVFMMLLPMLFSLGMLLPSYFHTVYTIDDHQLLVKSGLFKWQVPLSDIDYIAPHIASCLRLRCLWIDWLSIMAISVLLCHPKINSSLFRQ